MKQIEVKVITPNQNILQIIAETYLKSKNINEVRDKVNEWQKSRKIAEIEVFGSEISRYLNDNDIRGAIAYLRKRGIVR